MNASRASGARRLVPPLSQSRPAALLGGILAVAALFAWPADLRAQQPEAPISLFPPTVSSPGQAPDSLLPGTAIPGEEARGASREGGIEIDRLGELDTEALGILNLENGGLGSEVWAGSDKSLIEALVRGLPGEISSPTLRSLTVRLLLSSAKAPAPETAVVAAPTMADALAAAQTAETGASDFLRLRAERLYAMGELQGLNRLLSLVPQRVENPWLAQARVDGLLLEGQDEAACSQVTGGFVRYPKDLYWSKALVFCQFLAGQTDQALLGLDLLREQAPDSDPVFFALANAMILLGGDVGEIDGAALSPLTLAMLRHTAAELRPEAIDSASPLLLHGIAGLTRGGHEVPATAVERLAEIGALPGARLAGAYAAFEFTETELNDALGEAERDGGIRARALLFRAANRESLATARAEILRAALLAAEQAGRPNAMARAALPLMTDLVPALELAWFAPMAARNFYRVGLFERAGAWLSVLRVDGPKHPESRDGHDALRPYMRLAGGGEALTMEDAELQDQLGADRQLLLFVLSRALGQEEALPWIGLARWGDSGARALGRLPSLLALGDAAAAGRRGETVLLGATALGETAVADSHPLALGYTVSALSAVGLGSEARALAIEAALAAGF